MSKLKEPCLFQTNYEGKKKKKNYNMNFWLCFELNCGVTIDSIKILSTPDIFIKFLLSKYLLTRSFLRMGQKKSRKKWIDSYRFLDTALES